MTGEILMGNRLGSLLSLDFFAVPFSGASASYGSRGSRYVAACIFLF